MEILRVGSRGSSVVTLQNLLIECGYSITPDGIFGTQTEDKVIDFQYKSGLDADGIVGQMTWNALYAATSNPNAPEGSRINSTKYVLTTKNYYNEPYVKKNIVLHHTNGWTVQKGTHNTPSMNHFNWWKSTDQHVSTAFSIDYNGNIYQHFDPIMWAYHLGLGSRRNYLDKASIGIEITNEGFLERKLDGSFVWFSGDIELPYNRPYDEPYYIEGGWRDYEYYAPYSEKQIEATIWLCDYLCDAYGIKRNVVSDCDYKPQILDGSYEGVYTHSNVRDYPSDRPKWDISPAFPLNRLKKSIA
jgi:N-acetyl-anhydromuramyl-L-alanine amidase AmpD